MSKFAIPIKLERIRPNKKPSGSLIAFSGIDGAGKSTQIRLLSTSLDKRQLTSTVLWLRGGYTPGMLAAKAFLRRLGGRKILPTAGESLKRNSVLRNYFVRKLWLHVAVVELLWIMCVKLRYRVWCGETVICDRYVWDSMIDFQLNFPQEEIAHWWLFRLLSQYSLRPNVAILMLIPPEVSIERCYAKGEPFPNSAENSALRYQLYENLAQTATLCANEWLIIDATNSVGQIHHKIWETVSQVAIVQKT